MAEKIANLGYLALKKESTKGTAVTPDVFVPLYASDLMTNWNLDENAPIMGHQNARHQSRKGMRTHTGSFTVLGEPNTAGYLLDMVMGKGTTTGADPYTHPFTISGSNNSYTVEIAMGNQHVARFIGVEGSSLAPSFEANEMRIQVSVNARSSFTAREVASVSGSGPYTITLTTDYAEDATAGLIAGDLIQLYDVSAGTYTNAEVDSVDNVTQIEVSEDVSGIEAGDILTLRPQTASYSLSEPFKWSNTEFRFGATASAALSATQTRLEEGSSFTVSHEFISDGGALRSGEYDPESLPRGLSNVDFTARQYFDDPQDMNRWTEVAKRACVIRCFSNGDAHEMRLTLNNLKIRNGGIPPLSSSEIVYKELEYASDYDTSDTQAFDVKIINAVSSI